MELRLCESDFRFMEVVWEHAPVRSGELVKLCSEALGWKKPTTYTVIRKMCEKIYKKRGLCCFGNRGKGKMSAR